MATSSPSPRAAEGAVITHYPLRTHGRPSVILSSPPYSHADKDAPADFRTWPAGFTAPLKPPTEPEDDEPLVWEGDQA